MKYAGECSVVSVNGYDGLVLLMLWFRMARYRCSETPLICRRLWTVCADNRLNPTHYQRPVNKW